MACGVGTGGFSGAHGNVDWACKTSLPVNVHSWTCDIEHEALDVTPFSPADDAGVFVPLGIKKWSGSFDLWFDRVEDIDTAEIIGTQSTLRLWANLVPQRFSGFAICETVSITVPSDGPVTATVNFRGTVDIDVFFASTTTGAYTTTPEPTTTA